ncbi:hypothetical protein K488DRAFT_75440 [Vararia minispora EC-137]|uniref:Uncharacterized protein n=1 Tax=Vararia minispora EC-137 TaxID=1314806 RepID=A0ACB8Q3P0_9AGAM|nr:hypothetical protein K488DRAFT_75440 [Vararia minispora EC-137]
MSKIWFMLGSEGGSPGHAAYANKKGAMFTQLAEQATQKLRHAGYEPLGDDGSLIERLQEWTRRTEEGRLSWTGLVSSEDVRVGINYMFKVSGSPPTRLTLLPLRGRPVDVKHDRDTNGLWSILRAESLVIKHKCIYGSRREVFKNAVYVLDSRPEILDDVLLRGCHDIASYLLECGAPCSSNSLVLAARHGYEDIISMIVEAGVDPSSEDFLGDTALRMAIGSELNGLQTNLSRPPGPPIFLY